MQGRTIELKLEKVSSKFAEKGGYRAHMPALGVKGYDEIISETIAGHYLSIDPNVLKSMLSATFDTMINGILKDGVPRRLGDYFMLQLEVKGGFSAPDEDFDPAKHELVMKLRPLKEFRRKPGEDDVRVKVAKADKGPMVEIDSIHSADSAENGVLLPGRDIVLEGRNLFVIEDNLDLFTTKLYAQHESIPIGLEYTAAKASWVSEDGTKMTIPWDAAIAGMDKSVDPRNPPQREWVGLFVGLCTRGGVETARIQKHRAKAYFGTWLERYPQDRGELGKLPNCPF